MPTVFGDQGVAEQNRTGDAGPAFLDARQLHGCRHHLALDSVAARLRVAAPENPAAQQRKDAATTHRAQVRDSLTAAGGWIVIDQGQSAQQRVDATLLACARGARRIWGALLPQESDTGRRGGAEILLHDEDRGGYIPVIVVNHKVTDPRQHDPADEPDGASAADPGRQLAVTSGFADWNPRPDPQRKTRGQPRDQLRLVHLYRMLQRHGLASPALVGGAIGATFDCILVHDLGPLLDDYDRRYADRIAVVRGELPTGPSRVSECRGCPWWMGEWPVPRHGESMPPSGCEAVLLAQRDVSLIAVGARAEVLRAAGVTTIDELARWVGEAPDDWPSGDFADLVVAARAWLRGVPLVRRVAEVKVHRADVEVDIDLESFQEHGAYLWGTLLDGIYRPFATWDPLPTEDEGRSFGEFWTWLMTVRADAMATGRTFAAYCYTRTEDKWLLDSARRFAGRPGVPTVEAVRAFVGSQEWVDIFQAVTDQFICPNGKGLKKIAPVAGFAWRDPEAGGEASMAWYRAAVGYDGGRPDAGQRRRVLDYNEDDVRATAALREWMTERADAESPLAAELQPS